LFNTFSDKYEYSAAVTPNCNAPFNCVWFISVRHNLSLPGLAKKSNTISIFLFTQIVRVVFMNFWFIISFVSFIVVIALPLTVSGLAKLAIYTTNVNAENQCLIYHPDSYLD